MDLASLHLAVRRSVREGRLAAGAEISRLAPSQRAALQTWSRRLQSAGGDLRKVARPGATDYWISARPGATDYWIAARQPVTAS